MEALWQDLRYSFRVLRRQPGFTLVAVLTLALGLGANTAIFTVVHNVVLRPLPYPESDRIYQTAWVWPDTAGYGNFDHTLFTFLRENQRSFAAYAAFTRVGFNLTAERNAERTYGYHVSADYFRVLGAEPALGRGFLPEDDLPGAPKTAVISHGLWQRSLGGDPGVIGRTIRLDGQPYEIIGVMPAGFETYPAADIWAPIAPVAQTIGGGWNYSVIGRLRPDVSRQQAQAEFDALLADYRSQRPHAVQGVAGLGVVPYASVLSSDVRTPLFVLFGAIGFVLLIACANVANLLLARATTRDREIAVRAALGAPKLRLARLLITESVLIALLGAAAGLAVASWSVGALLELRPGWMPRAEHVGLDGWAFGFAVALALVTGILAGAAPAAHALRGDLGASLKEGGRTGASAARLRLRNLLVAGEVALSLMLLAGAGLLIQTFANLLRVDPGFDPGRVLSAQFWITGTRYESSEQVAALYDDIVARIEAMPGVTAAGVAACGLPLERGGNAPMRLESAPPDALFAADYRPVTPRLLAALGVNVRRGRGFTEADRSGAAPVAVVSESFARRYFDDREPLGERILVFDQPYQVVGVAGDLRSFLNEPAYPTLYVPLSQAPFEVLRLFDGWFPTSVVVATSVRPAALVAGVERALREADPQLPLGRVRPMEDVYASAIASERFHMTLLGIFAGLALALAAVGIYGVLSYAVSQRTREIGIRVALGAERRDILRTVLRQGMAPVLAGMALGLAGAFYLSRLLAGMLFQVEPGDPLVLTLVALVLVAVALAASLLPALRATRVDPAVALRHE
jgi:predicted permease